MWSQYCYSNSCNTCSNITKLQGYHQCSVLPEYRKVVWYCEADKSYDKQEEHGIQVSSMFYNTAIVAGVMNTAPNLYRTAHKHHKFTSYPE